MKAPIYKIEIIVFAISILLSFFIVSIIQEKTLVKTGMMKDGGSLDYEAGWPIRYRIYEPHKLFPAQQMEALRYANNFNYKEKIIKGIFPWTIIIFILLNIAVFIKFRRGVQHV